MTVLSSLSKSLNKIFDKIDISSTQGVAILQRTFTHWVI